MQYSPPYRGDGTEVALRCPLPLRAQGTKEKRGDHPLHFLGGFAVALLCTSSVLPDGPWLSGIEYVPELPGKMLSPRVFILFCTHQRTVALQFQSCPQDSSSLTGEQLKQSNVARCWQNRIWQSVDPSMCYWKAGKWLCVGETTTTYSLTCPCNFCFQQNYHLNFYPMFMRYLWTVWY